MSDRLREMLASSTPGPWKSSDARVLAYGNSGIADCKLHRAPSRQRANAALIALAPDAIALLIRADELFFRECDDTAREHCPTCEWRADLAALRGDERA